MNTTTHTAASQRIRLFRQDWLERFSLVHPLAPISFWGVVVSIILWRAYNIHQVSLSTMLILALPALLLWSLAEYVIHRLMFHFPAKHHWSERFIFICHGIHHADPQDDRRLLMPLVPAIILSLFFFAVFQWVLGERLAGTFYAFFIVGYLLYDYIHFYVHFTTPRHRIGRVLRRNHLRHHVHGDSLFGVSSPLWDYVFRTLPHKRRAKEILSPNHSS